MIRTCRGGAKFEYQKGPCRIVKIKWVAHRIERHVEVQNVTLLTPQVLRIIRKQQRSFIVATIAAERVEPSTFENLLTSSFKIEFLVNVPRESMWTGAAIELAARHSVGFGTVRDLFSATSLTEPNRYKNKEFAFVERGLRQHSNVQALKRIHDRKYLVSRKNLDDVVVVLSNEYELTADNVRTACDRYDAFSFSAILLTNPNARVTSSAQNAAESFGTTIYKWGDFLARLRRP